MNVKKPDRNSAKYSKLDDEYRSERDELVAILRLGDKVAWDQKLSQIEYPKLAEADLSDLELIEFNFDFADLRCANLNNANLSGASFRDADLRGAQLKKAYGRQT